MAKYLVIVESPAKVKTIKKFLGKNYEVAASNGHVRDLPKSQLGVDVEHDFEPKYITIRGKGDILANLRKEVKKADKVYLATDPDREGEAISCTTAATALPPPTKVSAATSAPGMYPPRTTAPCAAGPCSKNPARASTVPSASTPTVPTSFPRINGAIGKRPRTAVKPPVQKPPQKAPKRPPKR